MPNNKALRSLIEYKNSQKLALSLYLSSRGEFKNLLKDLPKDQKKALHNEINSIRNLMKNAPPTGKGVAVFASPDRFVTYELVDSPPLDMLNVGGSWVIYPLLYLTQYVPDVLLVIVHKNRVSLYRIWDRNVKKLLSVKAGPADRRTRLGLFGKGKGQQTGVSEQRNKEKENIAKLQRKAAQKIKERLDKELKQTNKPPHIVIVGQGHALSAIKSELPKATVTKASFINKIVGLEKDSNLLKIASSASQKIFENQFNQFINHFLPGDPKNTATNLSKSLEAVQSGKARHAAISIQEPIPGSLCTKCDYLIPAKARGCPACNSKAKFTKDITEHIVRKALQTADKVYLTTDRLPEDSAMLATYRY